MKVFITGTSRGLGASLACKMARNGHTVFGISRSGTMPPDWTPEFSGKFWTGDAASRETISRIASELKHAQNIPDIFVFNAALREEDLLGRSFNAEIAEHLYRVNFFSPALWIEEFLSDFLSRNSGIFAAVSSLVAYRPLSKGFHSIGYVASKAALSSSFDLFQLYFKDTEVKFLTFHFGRIGKPAKGIPCTPYETAADFLCRKLGNPKNKTVFNYPYLLSLVYRCSRLIPDRSWSKFIR